MSVNLLYKVALGELNFPDDEAIARDRDLARSVQERLGNFWLLDEPDGLWGDKSSAALVRFKHFRGLDQIPGITSEIAKELINTNPKDLIKGYKLNGDLATRVLMFYSDRSFKVATGKDECNIFYLEGMNRDGSLNNNDRFRWNDRRCIMKIVDGVPKITGNWLATSDPGEYYWNNPMNPNGCANVRKNAQYKAWITGYHYDQYSLVQAGEITVLRGRREQPYTDSNFGINQHSVAKGLSYKPGDAIGKWSAGCSVGADREEHDKEFMPQVDNDPREKANRGTYLHYTAFIRGRTLQSEFPNAG